MYPHLPPPFPHLRSLIFPTLNKISFAFQFLLGAATIVFEPELPIKAERMFQKPYSDRTPYTKDSIFTE
jgi:hypothetical protein